MNHPLTLQIGVLFLALCASTASGASPVLISEFMAGNSTTLADEDGTFEDWIEIHNPGDRAVNMEGWGLTDSPLTPLKWKFPATNLPPRGYLVVFASNKDRRAPGLPLHTNFKLSTDGEYLALVEPDGVTQASSFSPGFPKQLSDVSFGLGAQLTPVLLVSTQATGRLLVPSDGALGRTWMLPSFEDSAWLPATNGVGFEKPVPEFAGSAFPDRLLSGSPLLYLRFGESTGTETANQGSLGSSANGAALNGAQLGAPGPQALPYAGFESDNLGVRFDGIDDVVEVTNAPGLNPPQFTAGCWVRLTGGASRLRSPLSSRADQPQRGYAFQAGTNNRWSFLAGTGSQGAWTTINGPATTLNAWAFLVGTYDGTSARFYVNGASVGTIATVFAPNETAPLRIGGGSAGPVPADFFPGEIDEVFVLDHALSSAEILQHYRTATNGVFLASPSYASLLKTDAGAALYPIQSSAFLRLPFVVSNLNDIGLLKLRMKYDDGFVAYLNGQEMTGANAPAEVTWNSAAIERHPNDLALKFEEFNVTSGRTSLREGTNVLAIHGLNYGSTNRDFLLLAELEATYVGGMTRSPRYFATPTPGQPNSQGSADLGPILTDVRFSPAPPVRPSDSEDITVTARASAAFSPLQEITLRYRVMYGATNLVPMLDDGAHGDGLAGDGIYGAVIPASASKPGQLVRFFVTASDQLGRASRWPLFEDPDNSPEYLGTVIANPAITSALPIWEWFAQNPSNARNRTGSRGAVWFNGEYFANIFVRERGGFTSTGSQKFDFNQGYHVRINDAIGRVEEANLNSNGGDPSYMRIPLSWELHRTAGSAAGNSFPILMRGNNSADRVALFVEQVDERFLERRGYDSQGALYKFVQRAELTPGFDDVTDGVEKKTRLFEDRADLQAISDAVKGTNRVEARAAFLFDNLNLPSFVNYFAVRAITRNIDAVRKNFYFYRDTRGTGEWEIFPWDMDLTWGSTGDFNHEVHPFHGDIAHRWLNPDQWNWVWEGLFNDARIRPLILRRLRTVMDEFLAPRGRLEGRADALFAPAYPHLGSAVSNEVRNLKANIDIRRTELYVTYSAENPAAGVNGIIPPPEPLNAGVQIHSWEVTPASGNQAEEFLCLTNPSPYAIDLSGWRLDRGVGFLFKAGTVIGPAQSLYVSPDPAAFRRRTVEPRGGKTRQVVGPYQGQLSSRGETITLSDPFGTILHQVATPENPSPAQRFLRVNEIMYHPRSMTGSGSPADDFEFIEIKNISRDVTLDLSGVRFVNGIQFDFSTLTPAQLGPGGLMILVKDRAAFTARYGPRSNLAGEFIGSLDNAGERIQLIDASGEEILDFSYHPEWQPLTDGLGFSLVVVNEEADPDSWQSSTQWRSSGALEGSPGGENIEAPAISAVLVNEILARSEEAPGLDMIELHNPEASPAEIGGWWLSDDLKTPKKFRLPPETRLAPGGYHVISEAEFGTGANGFALSAEGDEVWLFSADPAGNLTGYVHGFRFGPTESSVTLGRLLSSDGLEHFVPQSSSTLGSRNSGPRSGLLRLSEVMFSPARNVSSDQDPLGEYLELENQGSQSVSLWNPLVPTQTWRVRGGAHFDFPTNITLTAGERILLVAFNPIDTFALASFRSRFGVPPEVRIFGPVAGRLDNTSDTVVVQRADSLSDGTPLFIEIERLDYLTRAPWPETANGTGMSLQRSNLEPYVNDPRNWIGAPPTPGRALPILGVPPVILVPPADQKGLAKTTTSFSVLAQSSPAPRYQWRHRGSLLPGATNATLLIEELMPSLAGEYDVLVYNDLGSALSSPATLTLLRQASIVTQPRSLALRPGSNATFKVTAYSPGPLSYQWRKDGTTIANATQSTLVLTNVQSTDAASYTVQVSDSVGSMLSEPATLALLVDPLIVQDPVSQALVPGSTLTLSVTVSNTATLPVGYRLRRNNVNVPASAPGAFLVLSQHTAYFTLTGSNAAPPWSSYSVLVTNQAKPSGVLSGSAVLTYLADVDRDGLPDQWETTYFGEASAADPNGDADGDGMSNWQEYVAGTDPKDLQSFLRIEASLASSGATVKFLARANRTYTLDVTEDLAGGRWIHRADFPASSSDHFETLSDPSYSTNRFYRLVTPRQP